MESNLLTIAIPTYNRSATLIKVIDLIAVSAINSKDSGVDLMVIDDDSNDGTYELLLDNKKNINMCVKKNETRVGFCRNFLNLIKECKTEYILFSTDDDFLIPSSVMYLVEYLRLTKSPPALISTIFRNDDGTLCRGAIESCDINEFEYGNCCNHLPGVVFNARLAKSVLSRIEFIVSQPINYYPQSCFSFVFLALGYKCIYMPIEVVKTGYKMPSGIAGYSSLAGRWSQFKFFLGYLDFLKKITGEKWLLDKIDFAIERHKYNLFKLVGAGIREEDPDLAVYYLEGARKFISGYGR